MTYPSGRVYVNLPEGNLYIYIWVNYNDLTATSLGMMVSRGDYPQMTLFQVSELLKFAQICDDDDGDDDENEWYGESSHTYPKLLVS